MCFVIAGRAVIYRALDVRGNGLAPPVFTASLHEICLYMSTNFSDTFRILLNLTDRLELVQKLKSIFGKICCLDRQAELSFF